MTLGSVTPAEISFVSRPAKRNVVFKNAVTNDAAAAQQVIHGGRITYRTFWSHDIRLFVHVRPCLLSAVFSKRSPGEQHQGFRARRSGLDRHPKGHSGGSSRRVSQRLASLRKRASLARQTRSQTPWLLPPF